MASHSPARILTFKADGAVAKGQAVKIGSDKFHVAKCTANTDSSIGIAQSAAVNAEDPIEVALPGGGAKGLAGESITAGKLLVAATDGDLEQTNAAGDRIIGMALQSASAGDIFAVEVVAGLATAADL